MAEAAALRSAYEIMGMSTTGATLAEQVRPRAHATAAASGCEGK